MADLKLDRLTHDIDISGNTLHLIRSYEEECRQRLENALQIYLGEWFVNTNHGVPYTQRLLSRFKQLNIKSLADSTLSTYISNQPYVERVNSFSSSLNRARVYTYSFQVKLVDGGIIDLADLSVEV